MSALLVATIAALCLGTAEFAISVVQLWNERTELGDRLGMLFQTVLSALLIILATLLLLYAENEAAVPILLVSLCAVWSISQGLHLSLWYEVYLPGSRSWVVGPISICFVIQFGLSMATGFLTNTEPQKTIDYVLLSVFLVEYFLMFLTYVIIHGKRVPPLSSNANLVWNMTICFIITAATSASLALYCHCIVDRTTSLLILVWAILARTLRPIWITLEKGTRKRNEVYAVSSVTGSNAALSA